MAEPDTRKALMKETVEEKYADALALGTTSNPAELTQQFRTYGLEGETGRKAIAFFVTAARFAGIELSPYWPKTRPGGGGRRRGGTNGASTTRKRSTRRKNRQREEVPPADPPAFDAKSRYIDLLLKKAEQDEDMDTDLLDRIERVIGVQGSKSRAKKVAPPPVERQEAARQDDASDEGGESP